MIFLQYTVLGAKGGMFCFKNFESLTVRIYMFLSIFDAYEI